MDSVGVAELKSRLSEHLHRVRGGRSLVVLNRDTPVARIVPYEEGIEGFRVRRRAPDSPRLQRVHLPPALRLRRDVVEFLLEERQGDR